MISDPVLITIIISGTACVMAILTYLQRRTGDDKGDGLQLGQMSARLAGVENAVERLRCDLKEAIKDLERKAEARDARNEERIAAQDDKINHTQALALRSNGG